MRNNAFTLAETLITLMVIGVLASITIPSLIQAYKERETVYKVKKAFSVISQAYINIKNNYGNEGYTTLSPLNYWVPYLAVVKKCSGTQKGCMGATYKMLTSNDDYVYRETSVLLKDGVALSFIHAEAFGYVTDKDGKTPGYIWVDINGEKEPNIAGKDAFLFVVAKDYIIPMGGDGTEQYLDLNTNNNSFWRWKTACQPKEGVTYNGLSCAGYIIKNRNMDYLP